MKPEVGKRYRYQHIESGNVYTCEITEKVGDTHISRGTHCFTYSKDGQAHGSSGPVAKLLAEVPLDLPPAIGKQYFYRNTGDGQVNALRGPITIGYEGEYHGCRVWEAPGDCNWTFWDDGEAKTSYGTEHQDCCAELVESVVPAPMPPVVGHMYYLHNHQTDELYIMTCTRHDTSDDTWLLEDDNDGVWWVADDGVGYTCLDERDSDEVDAKIVGLYYDPTAELISGLTLPPADGQEYWAIDYNTKGEPSERYKLTIVENSSEGTFRGDTDANRAPGWWYGRDGKARAGTRVVSALVEDYSATSSNLTLPPEVGRKYICEENGERFEVEIVRKHRIKVDLWQTNRRQDGNASSGWWFKPDGKAYSTPSNVLATLVADIPLDDIQALRVKRDTMMARLKEIGA